VIKDYSADALRYTIITSSAPGNDTRLDLDKVESARNFANKIWNVTRFIVGNLGDSKFVSPTSNLQSPISNLQSSISNLALADRWILSRLNNLIASVNANYENWNFGEGTRQVYDFLWGEFADWYIEIAKIPLNGTDEDAKQRTRAILVHTLDQGLRLLHPTMPFVTEEVWQHLPHDGEALIVAQWPEADKKRISARAEKEFARVMDIVRAIRNARAEYNVEASKRIPAIIAAGRTRTRLESQREIIQHLARLDPGTFNIETRVTTKPAQALALIVGDVQIYLPFAGMIDLEKEKARLRAESEKVQGDIQRAQKLLRGEFAKKAPKEVVTRERERLTANREKLATLKVHLVALGGQGKSEKRKAKRAHSADARARKKAKIQKQRSGIQK
jgi:valyl-tRNA synthetase